MKKKQEKAFKMHRSVKCNSLNDYSQYYKIVASISNDFKRLRVILHFCLKKFRCLIFQPYSPQVISNNAPCTLLHCDKERFYKYKKVGKIV